MTQLSRLCAARLVFWATLAPAIVVAQSPTVISGVVVAAGSGAPLRNAIVTASSRQGSGTSDMTDEHGRFRLRNLPAARYHLSARKDGYLPAAYGQTEPLGSSRAVALDAGVTREGITLVMVRDSRIAGSVTNADEEPLEGIDVAAAQYRVGGGRRSLVIRASATTNTAGAFRLSGLHPGDYLLIARPAIRRPSKVDRQGRESGYAPTFFPSANSAAEAQIVTLLAGQDARDIHLSMVAARLASIRGTVVNVQGEPLTPAAISLRRPADAAATAIERAALVRPDGTFELRRIPPGDYVLHAMRSAAGTEGATAAETAWMRLAMAGEDVEGVALVAAPPATVTGRVVLEGQSHPPAPSSIALSTESIDTVLPPGPKPRFSVGTDRRFTGEGLLGAQTIRCRVTPAALSSVLGGDARWRLKRVTYQGQDVIDAGIEFRPGEQVRDVDVVLTDRGTELTGTATGSAEDMEDSIVIVFAEDRNRWTGSNRFVAAATPDARSEFRFSDLPPQSYLAIALSGERQLLTNGGWQQPALLESLRPLAIRVGLTEGETRQVSLRIVRRP